MKIFKWCLEKSFHTYLSICWLVISHQGEYDHGDEVGEHTDVKSDSSKPFPFGPQQLIDGLHCQHLMAVLTTEDQKHDANRCDENIKA